MAIPVNARGDADWARLEWGLAGAQVPAQCGFVLSQSEAQSPEFTSRATERHQIKEIYPTLVSSLGLLVAPGPGCVVAASPMTPLGSNSDTRVLGFTPLQFQTVCCQQFQARRNCILHSASFTRHQRQFQRQREREWPANPTNSASSRGPTT